MRSKTSIMLCIVAMLGTGCLAEPPTAMLTLHVVNQNGMPVEDTAIVATFEGGKTDVTLWPNKNGYVTFRSPVLGTALLRNKVCHDIRHPDVHSKYYETSLEYQYFSPSKNAVEGKWMPWNPTIEMVLKERKKPIPMYAKGRATSMCLPKHNAWCGFDMEENDWVAPFGNGKHPDIEIRHLWDGKKGKEYTGSSLTIRFIDEKAGCYPFQYKDQKLYDFWEFRSPYHAIPSASFAPTMEFYKRLNLKTLKWDSHLFPNGTGYVFRTRTRFDNEGKMVGARYGKIYQPLSSLFYLVNNDCKIRLPFYLNPIENDINLEFDPKRNLLRDVRGNIQP